MGRETDLLFHFIMHSLVDLVCAQTRDQTHRLGALGWCSDHLINLAMVSLLEAL